MCMWIALVARGTNLFNNTRSIEPSLHPDRTTSISCFATIARAKGTLSNPSDTSLYSVFSIGQSASRTRESFLFKLCPRTVLAVVDAHVALLWFRVSKINREFLLRLAKLTN
jgi:hypothetical protein